MIDEPISGQFLQDHFLQYSQKIRISPDFNHTAWFWNFNYWTERVSVPVACDMEELESDGHLSFQTNPVYFHVSSLSDSSPRCINVRSVSLRGMRSYSFAIPTLHLLEQGCSFRYASLSSTVFILTAKKMNHNPSQIRQVLSKAARFIEKSFNTFLLKNPLYCLLPP